MRKGYYISSDNLIKAEKAITRFLLENADIVRFTNISWFHMGFTGFGTKGNEKDERFTKTKTSLEDCFIRKAVNNKRFNDITQGKKRYGHYFYRLSNRLKDMIKKEWMIWNSYSSKSFYGFEDPVFYKGKQMIGCIISHEQMAILYLKEPEKRRLEEKGIVLDAL